MESMSARKRRHESSDRGDSDDVRSAEEGEEGEMVSAEDTRSEGDTSDEMSASRGRSSPSSRHRHKAKKSKKSSKKKKKKKHRHHRRHRQRSREDGRSSRKRARTGSEDEDDGEISTKRKHRRRRHESDSEGENRPDVVDVDEGDDTEVEEEAGITDQEGGSTPELPELDEEIPLEKSPPRTSTRPEQAASTRGLRTSHEDGEIEEVEQVNTRERSSTSRRSAESSERSHRRTRDHDGRNKNGESFNRSRRRSRSPKAPLKDETRHADSSAALEEKGGSAKVISLSVEETNKLRASLGLAPLKVESSNKNANGAGGEEDEAEKARKAEALAVAEAQAKKVGGTVIPGSNKNEVHIPPENISEKTLAEKMREKIRQRKLKREQESKLLTLKKLGDSDSDDDTAKWVDRQKRLAEEKAAAEKRAKMLDQLDDEFGIGDIVNEDTKRERQTEYGRDNLRGLTVEHDAESFQTGRSVILTLKDADVLDEKAEDTLVNVNLVDDERTVKKLEDIKKAKSGYNAYDQEEVDEVTGEIRRKGMLDKYDEEIEGEKKKNFRIGDDGSYNQEQQRKQERERIRAKLDRNARKLESLATPELTLASDYLTAEERDAKFKKPKKKKKVKRRTLKADDLLGLEADSFGSRKRKEEKQTGSKEGAVPMDTDDTLDLKSDQADVKIEEDDDLGLHSALARMRKLTQRRQVENVEESLLREIRQQPIKKEEEEVTGSEFISTFEDVANQGTIILNETAEFCRNLGSRQMTRELERTKISDREAGEQAVHDDLLDFEESLKSSATRQHEERRGRWEAVEAKSDDSDENGEIMELDYGGNQQPQEGPRKRQGRTVILEEEPDLQQGIAAAIKVASSKGYWDKEEKKSSGSNLKHLQAKNYTIDDKLRAEDGGGSSSRSERHRYGGPTQPFQDKDGYVPNVKLEYIDDSGRLLNQKEAFRYLSHKFHGKGSGKMKTEKRMKKIMEEGLMKNMSSTDTPLQTLEKLRKKQEQDGSAFVVLTGNKQQQSGGWHDLKKF